jgi:FOG: PKD repeat
MDLCSSTVAAMSVALSKRDDHQAVYAAGNEGYYCGHRLSGVTNGIAGVNSKSASLTVAAFRYDISDAQGYSSHGFGTCGSQLENPKPDVGSMIPTIVPFANEEKNMETQTGGSSAGTSEAAPIVAGVAGLVASITGNARQSVIQGILESTASRVRRTQVNSIRGHDARFGNGQVQPKAAVEQAQLLQEQKAPNAVFTFEPTEVTIGDEITFDASGTTDPNEDIELYEWAFGDGSTTTGKTVTHTYENGGEKNVTLRVTDSVEKQSTYEQTVYINSPPDADFTVSQASATIQDTIRFNASNTIDPDNDIVSYNWSFGDGTEAQGEIVTHSFNDSGTYTTELQVIDSLGNTSRTVANINISASPTPQFSITPSTPQVSQSVTFNASSSADVDRDILSYNWDFGDGNTSSGEVVNHVYTEFGQYEITLTVRDSAGNSSSITQGITVNASPNASYNYDPQHRQHLTE